MSDNNQFDDDFFDAFLEETEEQKAPGPKDLREYAKRQRDDARKAREELAEFHKAQEDEKRTARTSKVDDLIKDKGLDPVVKEMIGDNDPEEWFAKYGSAFAAKKADDEETSTAGDTSGDQGSGKKLTPEQEAQLRGVTEVQPGNTPANTTGQPDLSELDGAKSLDEALAILAKQGLLAPEKSQSTTT